MWRQEPAGCSGALLALLLARLASPNAAPITRAAAAAYTASFLARASFVPDALLVQSLQVRCHLHASWSARVLRRP